MGDFLQVVGGADQLYVQADHPAVNVKGYNPTFPDLLGDPDTVKGSKILYTTGTTSHLIANKWLESIGVKSGDVEMLTMEYAQVYQAFSTKQADFASMTSPWCLQAGQEGYVKVADTKSLDLEPVMSIVMPEKAYNDEEMKHRVAAFIDALYDACADLQEDPALYREWVMKWYQENGNTGMSESDIEKECSDRVFLTWDNCEGIDGSKYHGEYADFLISLEQISAEQGKIIQDNTRSDIMDRQIHESHDK